MVTLENVLMLGLGLIVLTYLTHRASDVFDFVNQSIQVLIG